jgi:hypothetical protein
VPFLLFESYKVSSLQLQPSGQVFGKQVEVSIIDWIDTPNNSKKGSFGKAVFFLFLLRADPRSFVVPEIPIWIRVEI